MDQKIVDITDLPDVKSGDIAVFIGKSASMKSRPMTLQKQVGQLPTNC